MAQGSQLKVSDYQLPEVEVRLYLKEKSRQYSAEPLSGPSAAVSVMKDVLKDLDREMVCVVNLDNTLRPLNYHVVSIGSLNESMVPIQNVFKSALLCNAASLMLLHNHPGGSIMPSLADQEVTKRVAQAGRLMNVPLTDHVIIAAGTDEIYSFQEKDPGLLRESPDLFFSGEHSPVQEKTDAGYRPAKDRKGPDNKRRKTMSTLRFDEFKEFASSEIREWLPDQYQDRDIQLTEVTKIGEASYTGLTFGDNGGGRNVISPVISLVPYYRMYLEGADLDSVMFRLSSDMTNEIEKGGPKDSLEWVTDYDKVKEHLFIRVCNAGENQEQLQHVPHREVADLAITCHLQVDLPGDGFGSILITDRLMAAYGISSEQLYHDAVENSQTLLPARIEQLDQALVSLIRPVESEALPLPEAGHSLSAGVYMVTNSEAINGAAALFYPEVMDSIARRFGENFIVLPSSVHEVLVMPESMGQDYDELEDMVWSVNQSVVDPKDRLSDRVYHYDVREHVFERGKDYQAREHEKPSILQALKEPVREAAHGTKDQTHRAHAADMEL